MSYYDSRLKHVHDTDIFYADGLSLATATSWVSNTIDLGAAQAFINIPVILLMESSVAFSLLSSCSIVTQGLGNTATGGGMRSFMRLQDSADGSTWAGEVLLLPVFNPVSAVSSISIITAAAFNALNAGICSIKRYSRLRMDHPSNSTGTIKAWLRMGLTA